MFRVTVMSGPQDGQEAISRIGDLQIGRSQDADLALPHDPALPALGVVLKLDDEAVVVSEPGITRTVLVGELFQVGSTWLKVTAG